MGAVSTVRRPRGTHLALVGGTLLLGGVLAGCGSTVDSEDVTDQVATAIEDSAGAPPDATDCPDPLDAEEGATTTCTVTVDDTDYDVPVEVTGVDGGTADFDITVPEELRVPRVAADDLADQIASGVADQVGEEPEGVTCPEDLRGEVGTTLTCVLTAPDGTELDTEVEVTSVEGAQVNFSFEVLPESNG